MTARRNRKVPFNCYLSVEQLDALDVVSERESRPKAEIVREAVSLYLAQQAAPDGEEPVGPAPDVAPGGSEDRNEGAKE